MRNTENRFVEITILRNKKTDRLLAVCKEVEGFIAQGKDYEQLKQRIPVLMEKLLLARGEKVISVSLVESLKDEGASHLDDFVHASMIAQAQISSEAYCVT